MVGNTGKRVDESGLGLVLLCVEGMLEIETEVDSDVKSCVQIDMTTPGGFVDITGRLEVPCKSANIREKINRGSYTRGHFI